MNKPTFLRSTVLACLLVLVAGAQVRDPLPLPDVPGYKTLKADFHLHTVFSDGEVWPTMRVNEAWRDGLDVLAITDHAEYNPHKSDVSTDVNRPHALAQPLAEQLGLILIPGVEIAEGNIHCNLLFVTDATAFRGLKLLEALRRARAQGAFAFWNHPGWKPPGTLWYPLIASAHEEKLIQGLELVNGATFYREAFPWVEEKGLAIFANSDVHTVIAAQYAPRTRPVTLVFASAATAEGVREALLARRTAAWRGGELWGPEQFLRPLWQAAVTVENPLIKWRPGRPAPALRLRNDSAISYKLRVRRSPPWLKAPGVEIRAESVARLALTVDRKAPAGEQQVELEMEVSNVEVGPSQCLTVKVPLRVQIEQ